MSSEAEDGDGLAPIALFVYNRPEHTRRMLSHLAANQLASRSCLHVFSDGPKNEQDATAVQSVRQIIRAEKRFGSISLHTQPVNRGLAPSVIDGVTEMATRFGRVIVLEDDLLTAPGFLEYMNDALRRYADYPAVMQVSGYSVPINCPSPERAYFLPLTTSWGWATWQRAWKAFDASGSGYSRLVQDPALRRAFDLDGAMDYTGMLRDSLEGRNSSWAIRWYTSVFLHQGLVLYPGRSLTRNIGFDGSGVHCDGTSIYDIATLGSGVTEYPNAPVIDGERWDAVREYLAGATRTPPAGRRSRAVTPRLRPIAFARTLSGAISRTWKRTRSRAAAAIHDRVAKRIHAWHSHAQHLSTLQEFRGGACIDDSVHIFPNARLRNLRGDADRIHIGRNTVIRGELLVFAHAGEITIGQHCYIGDDARIWSSANVRIGNRVLISHGVNIHDTNSHPLDARERHDHFSCIMESGHPRQGVDIKAKPVVIDDDAWIGFNAVILKGVRVGRGAIVAAGAVVVKDVPPFAVAAGNPARVLEKHVA